MEQMPQRDAQPEKHGHVRRLSRHDPDDFFGLDVEKMSPKARVATGLAVILPVAVASILVLTVFSQMWWLIFDFGWSIFPAFGLLIRGIAGLWDEEGKPSADNGKERELLEALWEHGELTPARAAMETSLTVAEADAMLKGLAEGGHLEVRVRGGSLSYSLWEAEGVALGSEGRA